MENGKYAKEKQKTECIDFMHVARMEKTSHFTL